jgi:hypothetical protein
MAVFTLQGQQAAAAQPISSCVCTQTCRRDAPHFGPNVDGSVRGPSEKSRARVYRRPPFSNWVWKMSRSWNLLFSLSHSALFSLPHLADKKLISSLTQQVWISGNDFSLTVVSFTFLVFFSKHVFSFIANKGITRACTINLGFKYEIWRLVPKKMVTTSNHQLSQNSYDP